MKAIELNGTHVGRMFPYRWRGDEGVLPIVAIKHGINPGFVDVELRLDEINILQWRMPADVEVIFVE